MGATERAISSESATQPPVSSASADFRIGIIVGDHHRIALLEQGFDLLAIKAFRLRPAEPV